MSILPPSKPGDRRPMTRPVNTVMLRPIVESTSAKPAEAAILPSVRSSGAKKPVGGAGIPATSTLAGTAPVAKKRGRPTKAEKMRERRARVSDQIKALVDDDPSKADIHAYFEARIKELLAE